MRNFVFFIFCILISLKSFASDKDLPPLPNIGGYKADKQSEASPAPVSEDNQASQSNSPEATDSSNDKFMDLGNYKLPKVNDNAVKIAEPAPVDPSISPQQPAPVSPAPTPAAPVAQPEVQSQAPAPATSEPAATLPQQPAPVSPLPTPVAPVAQPDVQSQAPAPATSEPAATLPQQPAPVSPLPTLAAPVAKPEVQSQTPAPATSAPAATLPQQPAPVSPAPTPAAPVVQPEQDVKSVPASDKVSRKGAKKFSNHSPKINARHPHHDHQIVEVLLTPSQQKFIQDEMVMLLLPDDDVVLGELTPEGELEAMEGKAYISLFWKEFEYAKNEPKDHETEIFITTYNHHYVNYSRFPISINEAQKVAFDSVVSGNIDNLRVMLDNYPVLQSYDKYGDSLLIEAVEMNDLPLAKLLLRRGIYFDRVNNKGESALFISEKYGTDSMYKLMQDAVFTGKIR